MISTFRMQIDGWVQLTLGLSSAVAWLLGGYVLTLVGIWLLWLWQTGSALELWLEYQHHSRRPYLWFAPVLLLVAILHSKGIFLILLCALVYGWHTLRDYRVVLRRPRSFWDL